MDWNIFNLFGAKTEDSSSPYASWRMMYDAMIERTQPTALGDIPFWRRDPYKSLITSYAAMRDMASTEDAGKFVPLGDETADITTPYLHTPDGMHIFIFPDCAVFGDGDGEWTVESHSALRISSHNKYRIHDGKPAFVEIVEINSWHIEFDNYLYAEVKDFVRKYNEFVLAKKPKLDIKVTKSAFAHLRNEKCNNNAAPPATQPQPYAPSPVEELDALIGLTSVKEEVKKLANFLKVQQMRKENGLKASNISYHCVFTGNPGTGKTTVARIVAKIYKELGIISGGQLVETDRSGLIGEYLGQTAPKTNAVIDRALDGVLFIDEAYSLVQKYNSGTSDYGNEAITTLLKRMEDDRQRIVVIVAGYTEEMEDFINANPGLKSRFTRHIHFEDYTADELTQIFSLLAKQNDYLVTKEALGAAMDYFQRRVQHKERSFGNGREARNLFEESIERQSCRIAGIAVPTKEALQTIEATDIAPTPTPQEAKELHVGSKAGLCDGHHVGEMHPNGKWRWTEYAPGKFDWRSKNGKHWQ